MNWNFSKKRPSDKTRNPVVGEFFASEAIKDAGEALVREAIQNSLDARRDDVSAVSVRVYVSDGHTALGPERAGKWFRDIWPHYIAPGNGLRPGDVAETMPCRFLVFEDFGTSGLTGDRAQYEERFEADNAFFYFFRAEAKTAKHGDARGRWGIGKQVFPRASRAQTFFGYTETDEGGFLMGGCILKHHWVDGKCYKPDGFWGQSQPVDGDQLTVPVAEPAVLADFRSDFRLRRQPGERGLSVVVPWLDTGEGENHGSGAFNRAALAFSVLYGYFVPILEGRLEATVEDESGSFHLSRATYRDVLEQLRPSADAKRRQEIERVDALLRLAEKVQRGEYRQFDLGPCSTTKAGWTEAMLDEAAAAEMRDGLKDGQTLAVKATLTVRPKYGPSVSDSFMCFVEKDDRVVGRACHIREDLIIADVKSAKVPGYACLVRIERGPLATLLGDSENPAHTEWQASSRNFKDKYVYGGLTIDFVSGFAAELLKRIHAASRELDRTLLLDLFSDPGPEPASPTTKPERRRKGDGPDDRPSLPPPPPAAYRIHQVETGFVVSCPADRLPAGTEVTVKAAYETAKGNPFKAYDENDFRLDDGLDVVVTGCEVLGKERNELRVVLRGEDAELRVTGFDVNRDLQVKVGVSRPAESDAQAAEVESVA